MKDSRRLELIIEAKDQEIEELKEKLKKAAVKMVEEATPAPTTSTSTKKSEVPRPCEPSSVASSTTLGTT